MPGKSTTPEQLAHAIALRSAGLTLLDISNRVGVSVSTLQRVFRRNPIPKGEARTALVEAAKQQVIDRVTCDDAIREEAARQIADDLAHAAFLRERIAVAAEHLHAENLDQAAVVMRAAAAYSTAIKNTSDMIRHGMRFEKALSRVTIDQLPELVIREISDEEAIAMVAISDRFDS